MEFLLSAAAGILILRGLREQREQQKHRGQNTGPRHRRRAPAACTPSGSDSGSPSTPAAATRSSRSSGPLCRSWRGSSSRRIESTRKRASRSQKGPVPFTVLITVQKAPEFYRTDSRIRSRRPADRTSGPEFIYNSFLILLALINNAF